MKQTSKIHLIILAAGKSSRMGTAKGLIEINGLSIIKHHQKSFQHFVNGKIIIMAGDHFKEYSEQKIIPSAIVIKNDHVDRGQFYSLQLALRNLDLTESCKIFITPVDKLPPKKQTLEKLINSNNHATIPSYKSKKGHPILINNTFGKLLTDIQFTCEDARLDRQLSKLSNKQITITETEDETVTQNFNYPTDLPS